MDLKIRFILFKIKMFNLFSQVWLALFMLLTRKSNRGIFYLKMIILMAFL